MSASANAIALPVEVQEPTVKASKPKTGTAKTKYTAGVYCAPQILPPEFSSAIRSLEITLGKDIWLLVQNSPEQNFESLDDRIIEVLLDSKHSASGKRGICLLLDSPGGYAKPAYQIARTLNVQYGAFSVVIPRRAKSAATLLALGAEKIILSNQGELGPLDVQVFEADREGFISALDEVQALERLSAFSLQVVDRTMMLLINRSGKKIETLLPMILHHAAELTKPLIEKIDTVHYTQMSRFLKIAEEYAIRLLSPQYGSDVAEEIARHLVNNYPDHGFAIDAAEARSFKLRVESPSEDQEKLLDAIRPHLKGLTAVGCLKEVTS